MEGCVLDSALGPDISTIRHYKVIFNTPCTLCISSVVDTVLDHKHWFGEEEIQVTRLPQVSVLRLTEWTCWIIFLESKPRPNFIVECVISTHYPDVLKVVNITFRTPYSNIQMPPASPPDLSLYDLMVYVQHMKYASCILLWFSCHRFSTKSMEGWTTFTRESCHDSGFKRSWKSSPQS